MTSTVPAAPARPPASRSVNLQVIGGLLLVLGLGWLLREAGAITMSWSAIVSMVLLSLGLGLIVTARARAAAAPLVALGLALTLGLGVASAGSFDVRGGVGQVIARPTHLDDLDARYRLFAGEILVDLTDLPTMPANQLHGRVTFGQIVVTVPDDVGVRLQARVTIGDVEFLGESQRSGRVRDVGFTSRNWYEVEPDRRVTLVLRAFVGHIEVRRAGP